MQNFLLFVSMVLMWVCVIYSIIYEIVANKIETSYIIFQFLHLLQHLALAVFVLPLVFEIKQDLVDAQLFVVAAIICVAFVYGLKYLSRKQKTTKDTFSKMIQQLITTNPFFFEF